MNQILTQDEVISLKRRLMNVYHKDVPKYLFLAYLRYWDDTNLLPFMRVPSTHYSKSRIFVQKFNFDKTPPFFHPILLTIFLVKSKLSTAKKSKTTTFSRVFHPKKSTIFSGNQSWIFGQKMKISNSVH